ncbi:MAG: CPBP family intramembrane metalloprotease [Clostridia bacterium]|nr:CPBP family intramembrane metalloprotease [Clostridia bacterium]MBQ8861768.1 CPBP family intramembrane metalloprotease [Clostridia bacterium]
MDSYSVKPTIPYLIASVIYGGVIEEVMLRLFWMTLVAFILWKMFDRKNERPSMWVLITANIIAALLFAAGHLPATAAMLGLSPMIVFRCFLLNGGMGLMFGWLYRKYGLRYSMIAHGGCHIVSKLIWILFV